MEKIKVHISYLDNQAEQLRRLANELADMMNKYDVTADRDQVKQLNSQLTRLQDVLNKLPLA